MSRFRVISSEIVSDLVSRDQIFARRPIDMTTDAVCEFGTAAHGSGSGNKVSGSGKASESRLGMGWALGSA